MREILFRGKTAEGKWVYGYYVVLKGAKSTYHYILTGEMTFGLNYEEHEIIPETVGQYTGLVDKNGRRIFEGDIVKWFSKKYTVVYKDGRFIGEEEHFIGVDEYGFINLYGEVEVIGNIHDNKELLGVE